MKIIGDRKQRNRDQAVLWVSRNKNKRVAGEVRDGVLDDTKFKKIIRNLTSLKDPELLIEIVEYFLELAKVWISRIKHAGTRLAGLYFSGYSFIINVNHSYYDSRPAYVGYASHRFA